MKDLKVKNIRKWIVSALTAATSIASLGLAPDPWDKWITVAAVTLGSAGVFAFKNEPAVAPAIEPPNA